MIAEKEIEEVRIKVLNCVGYKSFDCLIQSKGTLLEDHTTGHWDQDINLFQEIGDHYTERYSREEFPRSIFLAFIYQAPLNTPLRWQFTLKATDGLEINFPGYKGFINNVTSIDPVPITSKNFLEPIIEELYGHLLFNHTSVPRLDFRLITVVSPATNLVQFLK